MRVVITGGSGLLGRALSAELAAAGDEVIILSRRPAAVRGLPPGARAEAWDGKTAAGWGPLVEGAAVIHLAGENIGAGRWTKERKQRLYASRIRSGEAVLAAIELAGIKPRVLLQASAVGYYGPCGDELVTEASPAGRGFLSEVAKDWEAVTADVEALGVRRVVLRTGVVLAVEGGALPRMALPFRLFAGGPMGDGQQWLPWLHLADAVAAMRFLLARDDAQGPFNLAAPNPVTYRTFAETLGQVLGRPSFLPAPAWALRLALGEMADIILTGQRAVPERLLSLGFTFRFPDLRVALEDLLR